LVQITLPEVFHLIRAFLTEPRPRQPLAALAVCAVLGIVAADRWSVAPWWPVGALALTAVVLLIRPSTIGCWLFCALAFFSLHTLLIRFAEGRILSEQLVSGPRVIHATGIVWNEPEKPLVWSRNVTARFRLKVETLELDGAAREANLLVNVFWAGEMPAYGDRVSLVGSVRNLEGPRNPGQFDFADYSRRQGVYGEIRATYPTDCRIESHGHGNPAQALAYRARHWIQRQLAADLEDSPEIAGLIESIILGQQRDTPEELKTLFQRTGTVHLVAVSGLSVVMLAEIAVLWLRFLRIGRISSSLMVIFILWAYVMVTGVHESSVRATVMYSLILLAGVFDRKGLSLNNLGAAALLILAWDTNQLFSTGFQFSFGVVLVIILINERVKSFLRPWGAPDPFVPRVLWTGRQKTTDWAWGWIAGLIAVSVSAWIGSLPFTAVYFHMISSTALGANLVAVPIAFGVFALGVATLLAAPIWKAGAVLCNNANWLLSTWMLTTLKFFTIIPAGYLYVDMPRFSRPPAAELTVLDLGEGGAMHLRAGGRDWLIDCGNGSGYERIVLPYLRARGVNWLDGLILAHGSTRRLGGAINALDDFQPRRIAESVLRDRSPAHNRLSAELAKRGLGKGLYERGDFIRVSDALALRVLYPPAGLKRSAADDKALVFQIDCNGARVLCMSDSGFATEQWLMENEPDLRSELLIKGQHTKDFSATPDFLARVQPQAIVCGAAPFGQPPEALDGWERDATQAGIAVFRQDHSGAVEVIMRDGRFEARSFLGGQTFLSRAR
jgi:competence protein ComEC